MNRTEQQLLDIQNNSFKNYHVKGFDYVCLSRSDVLTEKLYFFDGDVEKLPEVVNPHNHRYDFKTVVLCGELVDYRYTAGFGGERYNRFNWRTPLNGGDGFEWVEECGLSLAGSTLLTPRARCLFTPYNELHTIRIAKPNTVLKLDQFADVVSLDVPTQTFMKDLQPPSLDGLYEKFTIDELLTRLALFDELGAA